MGPRLPCNFTGALGAPEDEEIDDGEEVQRPEYKGITPGDRDHAEPFDTYLGRKKAYLIWLGYEPGIDRVFFQLSKPVDYTISKSAKGDIQIDLQRTGIATENNTRPLDLSYFNTVASKVWAKKLPGGDTRLTIRLKERSTYRLERKGRYIYVYFRG